ncbi:hypothetical protein YTPLAS18_34390 [Nitrospira sp.]|nr:hypothetical protein YTPLAS18_34390 [Nitrospira sp.]
MTKRGVLSLAVGALLLAGVAAPAFADPPVLPEDKVKTSPVNIPPVPRGMPDLTPYWAFDPPKSPLFDLKNLTVSGDMRVRPEFRTNATFNVSTGAPSSTPNKQNDWYVQQWARLGIDYAVSPDVDFFIQPQWAKNWGAANVSGAGIASGPGSPCGAGICANDSFNVGQGDSLFLRQAFMMIRNVGVQNLNIKAGRQLIVMGNHRLFGHFDWANTGFSHDGVTVQYSQPTWELWGGWLRAAEFDFASFGANTSSFGVVPPGVSNNTSGRTGGSDANMMFTRFAWKPMAGLSLEPLWVWFKNDTPATGGPAATSVLAAHAASQSRHTVGGRAALRKGMFDGTAEGYYQFGTMNLLGGNGLHISAYALAFEGGITLPGSWAPRVGAEFNYASGDGDGLNCNSTTGAGCNGTANTFENLYPTNHIVMGYADLMSWRNMVAYSASFQFKPMGYAANHFEFRYWNFRKANSGDAWYRAAQNAYFTNDNGRSHLFDEIDFIYTLFFKGNKVAWQTGVSYMFAGSFVDGQATGGLQASNQTWGYTQLHINF